MILGRGWIRYLLYIYNIYCLTLLLTPCPLLHPLASPHDPTYRPSAQPLPLHAGAWQPLRVECKPCKGCTHRHGGTPNVQNEMGRLRFVLVMVRVTLIPFHYATLLTTIRSMSSSDLGKITWSISLDLIVG